MLRKNIFLLFSFLNIILVQNASTDPVTDQIMVQQQQTMIISLAEQIVKATEMLSKLNEQIDNLKEQLDLEKQINEGMDSIPGVKDVKALYGSVLDLQEGFNSTVANVDDLVAEIEDYFGPIEFENVEWGDRYMDIKVGRQTASASLISALELKQKVREIEESNISLMEKDIEGLDPKGLSKFIAQALKNLLTLQMFQAKSQAQKAESDAAEQLSQNKKEIEAAQAEYFWQEGINDFVGNLSDIAFYTPHNWKIGK